MLEPVERAYPQVGSRDRHKTCECHSNKKGLTIEECIEFKNVVCHLFSIDSTPNTWGDGVLHARDEPRLDISVTEKIIFYRWSFTPFKITMIEIYSELAQNGVFTYFYRGMDMLYSF